MSRSRLRRATWFLSRRRPDTPSATTEMSRWCMCPRPRHLRSGCARVAVPLRLTVRAHPRASRARLRWDGQTLQAWVTAAAAEGAANRALTAAIPEWLNVPRSAVRILAGARGRTKMLEVDGLTALPPASEVDLP